MQQAIFRGQALLWVVFSLSLTGCAMGPVTEPEPTVEYLSDAGVYQVESYTDLPAVDEYQAATVYYPGDKDEPFGAVAIAPGYTETQEDIAWWGPRLASHGYAVLIFDTNEPRDYPDVRAEGLIAAVDVLAGENRRSDSPLQGRLDTDRMAVMGHSMGGGGALLAAHAHSDRIRAAIPFTPWQPEPDFNGITVPTLVIAGEADEVAAVDEHAWPHYQAIPDDATRAYLEFAEGNHFIGNSRRSNLEVHPQISRYAVAWLKQYVDGDERYQRFLTEEAAAEDGDALSRFVSR